MLFCATENQDYLLRGALAGQQGQGWLHSLVQHVLGHLRFEDVELVPGEAGLFDREGGLLVVAAAKHHHVLDATHAPTLGQGSGTSHEWQIEATILDRLPNILLWAVSLANTVVDVLVSRNATHYV